MCKSRITSNIRTILYEDWEACVICVYSAISVL
jgi:hypothetical protein